MTVLVEGKGPGVGGLLTSGPRGPSSPRYPLGPGGPASPCREMDIPHWTCRPHAALLTLLAVWLHLCPLLEANTSPSGPGSCLGCLPDSPSQAGGRRPPLRDHGDPHSAACAWALPLAWCFRRGPWMRSPHNCPISQPAATTRQRQCHTPGRWPRGPAAPTQGHSPGPAHHGTRKRARGGCK